MAQEKKTVLVVDDSPANIFILNNILKDGYLVKGAPGGEIALKIIC